MEILVLYKDLSYAVVKDYSLDKLIREEKIVGFQRSSGWVSIGHDPVRGTGGRYSGPERRKFEESRSV
ncbi:MAG: hypothetical protein FD174_1502 [Geobacteraceae bacterium]|nr:MAG: hypothetical protein FD174_1502 [Geobacteraceae bacterium]